MFKTAMRHAFETIRVTRTTNLALYRRVVLATSRQDERIEQARARRRAEKAEAK